MSEPQPPVAVPASASTSPPSLIRSAIWVAIGALIAAAIVCVVWVLAAPSSGIIARAFLTILLLAGFAGAALFDAYEAPRRSSWYMLASMVGWVVVLLAGAFKIWLPLRESEFGLLDNGFTRFVAFVGIVLVIRLALLHLRLYLKAYARHATAFTRGIAVATVVLVVALALLLLVPMTLDQLDLPEFYWRIVVAVAILASVGTALLPLINALNAPRAPRPAAPQLLPWPMYADGVTPLPAMPDGSPDFNAYYTGYPSTTAQAIAPVVPHPVAPAVAPPSAPAAAPSSPAPAPALAPQAPTANPYSGYPPPPPLPPQ